MLQIHFDLQEIIISSDMATAAKSKKMKMTHVKV